MILLIDNYDSFVYNLARHFNVLGKKTQVLRNDKTSLKEIAKLKPSHLVLSPGPCAPNQAGICLAAIKEFYQYIPILGVCLGHQAIGQAFGGKIIPAIKPIHGKQSMILHQQIGIFAKLSNPLSVGRYHSLVVASEALPEELQITAISQQEEIMGLEHQDYPVYGIQFHPESILSEQGYQLLSNFLQR